MRTLLGRALWLDNFKWINCFHFSNQKIKSSDQNFQFCENFIGLWALSSDNFKIFFTPKIQTINLTGSCKNTFLYWKPRYNVNLLAIRSKNLSFLLFCWSSSIPSWCQIPSSTCFPCMHASITLFVTSSIPVGTLKEEVLKLFDFFANLIRKHFAKIWVQRRSPDCLLADQQD